MRKAAQSKTDDVAVAFDTSERTGKLLVEAFMYRFHSQTNQIRTLVADGAVGPVRLIRASHSFTMTDPATDVRTSAELEGGALLDVGCYCVSAFRLLVGEPERVLGYAEMAPSGVDLPSTTAHRPERSGRPVRCGDESPAARRA